MPVLRITAACLFAAFTAGALAVERQWTGATQVEGLFRRMGIIVGADRRAADAYRDLWKDRRESLDEAIREFQQALISDLASPYRWSDLAEAFVEAGRDDKAKYCLARAVDLGPFAPPILMRAANSYFRLAETSRALRCSARILAIVPDYSEVVFATYRRMGVGIDQILAEGVPAGIPGPLDFFLRQLLARQSFDDARRVWRSIRARGLADDRMADEYSAALLRADQLQAAVDCWVEQFGRRAKDYRNGNYLFNSGFEHDPLGETFDWRIRQQQNAHAEPDVNVYYSGHASLRIQFAGNENVAYNHVSQTVFLDPGRYLFEAHLRTAAVTTDEGIGFRIRDARDSSGLNVTTARLAGTNAWVCLRKDFLVKSPARLFEVQIIREPSAKFDSNIAGRAWVDNVSLRKLP